MAETRCKGLVNIDHIVFIVEHQDDTRGIGGSVFYDGVHGAECGLVSEDDFSDLVKMVIDK